MLMSAEAIADLKNVIRKIADENDLDEEDAEEFEDAILDVLDDILNRY